MNAYDRTSGRACSAFTLIELLVVIAIISLLISLVTPSLGRARRSAAAMVCMSNLRQMHMATMNHANDHRQSMAVSWTQWHMTYHYSPPCPSCGRAIEPRIPQLQYYITGSRNWAPLGPGAPSQHGSDISTVATCPTRFALGPIYCPLNSTYSINRYASMYMNPCGGPGSRCGIAGMAKSWVNISHPAQMLLFMDSHRMSWLDAHGMWWAAKDVVPTSILDPRVEFPHDGWSNMGFADGHVSRRSLQDMQALHEQSGTPEYRYFWYGRP